MGYTIWKYAVPVRGAFQLEMPRDARVLSVQIQNGEPQVWVVVDADAPTEMRAFRVFGTGHPIDASPDIMRYVGTFQLYDCALVFHLFEALP